MTIQEAVTKKLKLFSRRKVVTLLSGNYDSLFRGRGLEIDTLREYVAGDDIKDIDWKATARTGTAHTRLYAALRDQRVVILADTSRSMLLDGYSKLNKQDAIYGVCVMLGAFVKRNQDLLALCVSEPNGTVSVSRFNNTSRHIESVLRNIDRSMHAPTNHNTGLDALGKQLLSSTKRRSAVFVVTDSVVDPKEFTAFIATLSRRHQVFYVQLAPTWPFAPGYSDDVTFTDIESGQTVSPDLAVSPKLQKEWRAQFDDWYKTTDKLCQARGIPHGLITDANDVPDVLRRMFIQAKQYAIRRK
ncbi:MAG TPA: DUF58 domain-containing protein [Magnetospirillaceae bacterium]|nr:DUF58 domain-containing protein [Magnetospirillaceae bacterium]